ncbi:hypothetical protein GCG54_00008048 [Colletotrichum gloeosporioides]|uniref:Uncharacterized protein n=1 Tax=Colletotrichum gloeosporioides TaxID=474922 RepID=A0A8H4CM66_COLGL|nr:uncharacterized protein GCG54_00008048 [Colletotrichum gloeosporioides]KAF3806533.1 hypothetical protein GCG54_00008048 [Colletotrichum gloeosporioides]
MKHSAPALVAFIGMAAAQTTTTKIDVVVPYMGNSSFHASVQDAKPAATTYILGCEADVAKGGCVADEDSVMDGTWDGLTIINGPKTVALHHTYSDKDMSIGFEGSIEGSTMRVVETQTQSGSTVRMGVWNVDIQNFTVALTVTAGLDKLKAQATATAETGASATGSGAAQTGGSATGSASPTSTPNAAIARFGKADFWVSIVGIGAVGALVM